VPQIALTASPSNLPCRVVGVRAAGRAAVKLLSSRTSQAHRRKALEPGVVFGDEKEAVNHLRRLDADRADRNAPRDRRGAVPGFVERPPSPLAHDVRRGFGFSAGTLVGWDDNQSSARSRQVEGKPSVARSWRTASAPSSLNRWWARLVSTSSGIR
jgi:hypothetical protein